MEQRMKIIMKTSFIGIGVNILLATFKVIVGLVANSISVLMDGVNNFADAGTNIITIVGAALAGKPADKKHPFGYGRIEYLSSLLIAAIILYTGITSFVESVKGIISPEVSEYSALSLVVIILAVAAKFVLAMYTQKMGKKANSDSLVASGKEALLDVILSIATVIVAIIYMTTGLGLEAYVAAVISLLIIKTGFDVLKETISKIIGEPEEVQMVIDIKKLISSIPGVNGAYDIVLNNYGPETYMGSVHVEVDDTLSVNELDKLTRIIVEKVLDEYNVVITAVGFYSHRVSDEETLKLERAVREIIMKEQYVKGIHGFYIDEESKQMRFDTVVSFDSKDRTQTYEAAIVRVREAFPEYTISSAMDSDFFELV